MGRNQWGQGPGPAWVEGLDLGPGLGDPGVVGPEGRDLIEDPMGALLGGGGGVGGGGGKGHGGRSAPVLPAVHMHGTRAGTLPGNNARPGSAVPRHGARPGMSSQRRARPSSAAGIKGSKSEATISGQRAVRVRPGGSSSSSTVSRSRHSRGHRPKTAATARRKVQSSGGLHGPGGLAEKNIRAATRVYGAPVLGGGTGVAMDARGRHMNTHRQGPGMPRMPPIGGKRTGPGNRPSSARLPPVAGGHAASPGGMQSPLG